MHSMLYSPPFKEAKSKVYAFLAVHKGTRIAEGDERARAGL